jgi:hypothetical protein
MTAIETMALKAMALEETYSKVKRTIVTAVGWRGKWRTRWHRGVTTRPVQS